ncbi:MAG: hypothetical protein ACR2HG_04470 [Pyrinomonadaceae bacterium]
MANNKTKRLRPIILQEDLDAYSALLAITNYNPSNTVYKIADVTAAKTAKDGNQTVEVQKKAESDAARDDATASEWDFHDMILGVKEQVKAQFGASSNEFASLGMKKKSEYRTGQRKPKNPPNN